MLITSTYSHKRRMKEQLVLALCVCLLAVHNAVAEEQNPAFVVKLGLRRHKVGEDHQILTDAVQHGKLRAAEFRRHACRAPVEDLPVSGVVTKSSANFVTTLAIGTPPVNFTAVVDTGSSLVWQQCKPCFACYTQKDPIFDPSLSSTYKRALCSDPLCKSLSTLFTCDPTYSPPISCIYNYTYSLGSGSGGDLSYDTLTLHDATRKHPVAFPHFGFGCGLVNSNPSNFSGAAGVVGLGRGPTSLITQLSIHKFSYCLQSFLEPPTDTSMLYLGPAPTPGGAGEKPTIKTPLLTNPRNPSPYYIKLKGISVSGNRLRIPAGTFDLKADGSGGTIIDTGSLPTMLPQVAYAEVLRAMQESIPRPPLVSPQAGGLELCYASQVSAPEIVLHLQGGDLRLPTENYFVEMKDIGFCFVMAASPAGSPAILGSFQQQNVHIGYDLSSNLLSLTPTPCHTLP